MHDNFAAVAVAFPWFFPTAAFLVGTCVGSFLNVVIYRVPQEESIVTPGSHCACGQPIKWHDNIPILSWFALRGRARCCGRAFSIRYPFVELLTGALFVVCWLQFPPTVAVCGAIFISCLVAATFIDLDHFIIPDTFTLGLGVVGLLLSIAVPALHEQHSGNFLADSLRSGTASLLGSLVGCALVLWISLLAEAVLKKHAMGFGDVKFVGAIGAFCGWQGAVFSVFGGALVGTLWFAIAWVWQKISGKSSPVAPPIEKPQEEDEIAAFGFADVFTLGAGVIGVAASFFIPALHAQDSGVFFLDSFRSGVAAIQGLLIGSGFVLWVGLLVESAVKKELIPFGVVKFAGAFGSLYLWPQGVLSVLRSALLAALAGGLSCLLWWLATRLRQKLAKPVAVEDSPPEVDDNQPATLGFGVHVPFGPMLAIAATLYFLVFRGWVTAWLVDVSMLF